MVGKEAYSHMPVSWSLKSEAEAGLYQTGISGLLPKDLHNLEMLRRLTLHIYLTGTQRFTQHLSNR